MPSQHPLAKEVVRLLKQRRGVQAVADKLGLGAQTVRNIREAMGLSPNPPGSRRNWNPEVMAVALERYHKGGISIVHCEKEHGLPRNAMRDHLQRLRRAARLKAAQEAPPPPVEPTAVKRLPEHLCAACLCVRDRVLPCGCVGGWR